MTSPSMQPERSKPAKPAGRRRLDGDPAPSINVGLSWNATGVTVTFPESVSSASWDGGGMTQRPNSSATQWSGSGRNATNSLTAVVGGTTYANASIANGAASATLNQQ